MKELQQFINEHKLDKYISNTYPDDPIKSAVYDYVAGLTTSINNLLRKNQDYPKITKLLDKAFFEATEINVYRTVDWDYMKNIYGITPENVYDKISTEIINKGYMSTTSEYQSPWASRWLSGDLILHITSKEPYPFIEINSMFRNDEIDCASQNEYLLPRNTKMILKDVELKRGKKYDKNGTYQLELEIIS